MSEGKPFHYTSTSDRKCATSTVDGRKSDGKNKHTIASTRRRTR